MSQALVQKLWPFILAASLSLLLGGCADDGDTPSRQPQVQIQNVSFHSNLSSGSLTLDGVLFTPKGAKGKLPVILLVAGSGPNNAFETVVESFFATDIQNPEEIDGSFCYYKTLEFQPLKEVGTYLAQQGYAVYSYNKRTCVEDPAKGCYNTLCVTEGQQNCLNVSNLKYSDFIHDAASAVAMLRSRSDIKGDDMTIVGHSEGCNLAPYIADEINASTVVLLMGFGSDLAGTSLRQGNQIVTRNTNILNESICSRESAVGSEIMDEAEKGLALMKETLKVMMPIWDEWRAGVNPFPPHTTVNCGPFGSGPSQWWFETFQYSNPLNYSANLAKFFGRGGTRLLAVNSPTDLNVAPADYLPLQAMLAKHAAATHSTIPELTHLLSPADLASANVSSHVLDLLGQFLKGIGTSDLSQSILL